MDQAAVSEKVRTDQVEMAEIENDLGINPPVLDESLAPPKLVVDSIDAAIYERHIPSNAPLTRCIPRPIIAPDRTRGNLRPSSSTTSCTRYMAAPPRQNRRRNPTRGGEGPTCTTKKLTNLPKRG